MNSDPGPTGWRRKNDGEAWTLPFSLSDYGQPEQAGKFEIFCFPNQRWNRVLSSSIQTGRRRFARFLLMLRLLGASQNPLDQDFHVRILDVGIRRHRNLTPDTPLRTAPLSSSASLIFGGTVGIEEGAKAATGRPFSGRALRASFTPRKTSAPSGGSRSSPCILGPASSPVAPSFSVSSRKRASPARSTRRTSFRSWTSNAIRRRICRSW